MSGSIYAGTGGIDAWNLEPQAFTGGGGFVDNTSTFAQPSWWDRNFGDISDDKLVGALKELGKGAGAAGIGGAGAGDRPVMPGAGPAGQIGKGGGGGVSLDALVQLLAKRREALMQSATGGVGAGQAQGAQRVQGLLGL